MEFKIHEGRLWQPVHTRPRCEKKFQRFCDKYDLISYLPLKLRANTIRNKIVKSQIPMFPGYAFACLNDEEKAIVSRTNSVVNFINLSRAQEKSLVEDLRSINILEHMQENQEILVSPEIQPGSEISVKYGALRGLTGIVEKRKNIHRIVVNIDMISQSVAMEMDSSDVEIVY